MKTKNCNLFKLGLCVSEINPQPLENFFESKGVKDGRGSRCKSCIKAIAHERRLKANGGQLRVPKRPPAISLTEKNCCNLKRNTCASPINPQPIENFRPQLGRINGRSLCILCEQKYTRDNNYKAIIRARKWNKDNPLRAKHTRIRNNYGLTPEGFNKLFEEQKGYCPICKRHNSEVHQGLVVDHCHINGYVRGLLCHSCNRGLGMFKDSTEFLKNAIQYLEVRTEEVKDDIFEPNHR